jgi:hypothetical protein
MQTETVAITVWLLLMAFTFVTLGWKCDKPSPMPIYREAEPPIIPPFLPQAGEFKMLSHATEKLRPGDPVVISDDGTVRLAEEGEVPMGHISVPRTGRPKLTVIR